MQRPARAVGKPRGIPRRLSSARAVRSRGSREPQGRHSTSRENWPQRAARSVPHGRSCWRSTRCDRRRTRPGASRCPRRVRSRWPAGNHRRATTRQFFDLGKMRSFLASEPQSTPSETSGACSPGATARPPERCAVPGRREIAEFRARGTERVGRSCRVAGCPAQRRVGRSHGPLDAGPQGKRTMGTWIRNRVRPWHPRLLCFFCRRSRP